MTRQRASLLLPAVAAPLLAAGLAGCGGAAARGAPSAPSAATAAASPRSNGDVISADEIRGGQFRDVYNAVERLRPRFLRSRGATSARDVDGNLPIVFVDEQRLGGVASMRGLPVDNVREIRFIAPGDATTRWGTGYTAGVIMVVTRGR